MFMVVLKPIRLNSSIYGKIVGKFVAALKCKLSCTLSLPSHLLKVKANPNKNLLLSISLVTIHSTELVSLKFQFSKGTLTDLERQTKLNSFFAITLIEG